MKSLGGVSKLWLLGATPHSTCRALHARQAALLRTQVSCGLLGVLVWGVLRAGTPLPSVLWAATAAGGVCRITLRSERGTGSHSR